MSERVSITLTDLTVYRGQGMGKRSGSFLRFFCPVHGSDRQRSLQVNPQTGHFRCYACGCWGYIPEWASTPSKRLPEGPGTNAKRQGKGFPFLPVSRPSEGRSTRLHANCPSSSPTGNPATGPKRPLEDSGIHANESSKGLSFAEVTPVSTGLLRADLRDCLSRYQEALPGSWGEEYLKHRGIPLSLAQTYGLGYAPKGQWPNPRRDWKWGRLVVPHTTPNGEIINLYGRAVGAREKVPKELRHDHLPGSKGVFNAQALTAHTCFVCEGALDALSLIAVGYPNTAAIFGITGLPWSWIKAKRLVLCLDADGPGQKQVEELGWQGFEAGIEVFYLPADLYGPGKDLNDLWLSTGRIDLGEFQPIETPLLPAERWRPQEVERLLVITLALASEGQAPAAAEWGRENRPELIATLRQWEEAMEQAFRETSWASFTNALTGWKAALHRLVDAHQQWLGREIPWPEDESFTMDLPWNYRA